MMRILSLLFGLLFCCVGLSAQTTPVEWIAALNKTLGQRYAYGITINATSADNTNTMHGAFKVDGDAFYLRVAQMEVYSDGKLRYEINNERKEVTEDRVNLKSHDLLANPTRAFMFLDKEFDMSLRPMSDANSVYVDLVPRADIGMSKITLALRRNGGRVEPQTISYFYDSDVVVINLHTMDSVAWTLPRWNKNNYKAYDMVSFL